jgi:hypothetical protein
MPCPADPDVERTLVVEQHDAGKRRTPNYAEETVTPWSTRCTTIEQPESACWETCFEIRDVSSSSSAGWKIDAGNAGLA